MLDCLLASSLLIEISDLIESLLVCDHALVGALHLVKEHDINISLSTLLEACWHNHSIEQVLVKVDVLVFVL
jgi:hypothetical protein